MSDISKRLSKCYASAIHDVLREKGYGNCVLPPEIQALKRGQKLFGEIYTVSGHIDKTLTRHESLLLWSRVLSKVPTNKVLICQPNTHSIAFQSSTTIPGSFLEGERVYQTANNAAEASDNVASFTAKILLATSSNEHGFDSNGGDFWTSGKPPYWYRCFSGNRYDWYF